MVVGMEKNLKESIMSKCSKIIVGGCSFTDKNMPRHAKPKPLDFKMWATHIGEWSNCEVINVALSGYGNQAIYHTTLKEIWKNLDNIEHDYVMWSEWARQDFMLGEEIKKDGFFQTVIPRLENDEYNKTQEFYQRTWSRPFPNMQQLIDTNMNYIYSMQAICKQLGIKYTACQALTPIPQFVEGIYNVTPFAFKLVKHPLIEKIENFMGWPMIYSLAGFNITELCNLAMGSSWRISLEDAHPNEKAQKFIASKIYEYSGKS